jgi:hypothetical protein
MRIVARITTMDGEPVSGVKVEVLTVGGSLAPGVVKSGRLTLSFDDTLPAAWALALDGQPVLAFPVKASADTIDLGEIVTSPDGWRVPAFHAPDGRVFGVPRALAELKPQPVEEQPVEEPPQETTIDFAKAVPLRVLLESSTKQLGAVSTAADRLQLTGATVTVRGLPSGSGSDFSLSFPEADLAKNASGLSELSFALRPDRAGRIDTPVTPETTNPLPDLTGYTRDLAARKLAAAGLAVTVASEVVTEPRAVGRVVRQTPAAGRAGDPEVPVQIFIGKAAGVS